MKIPSKPCFLLTDECLLVKSESTAYLAVLACRVPTQAYGPKDELAPPLLLSLLLRKSCWLAADIGRLLLV